MKNQEFSHSDAGWQAARMIVAGALVFAVAAIGASYEARAATIEGKVTTVVNGHLFKVSEHGRELTVLLRGVTCPPIKTELGKAARKFSAKRALNETVKVVTDTALNEEDLHHVVVADITLGNGTSLSESLLRNGLGTYDQTPCPNRSALVAAEQSAQKRQVGVWKTHHAPKPPKPQTVVDAAGKKETYVDKNGVTVLKLQGTDVNAARDTNEWWRKKAEEKAAREAAAEEAAQQAAKEQAEEAQRAAEEAKRRREEAAKAEKNRRDAAAAFVAGERAARRFGGIRRLR